MIGIRLPENKKCSLEKTIDYLNPKEVVFHALKDQVKIKNNDIVKEGDVIARKEYDLPIIASISGKVTIKTNGDISTIKIKNNNELKEYTTEIPYNYIYTKSELATLLKENGIEGMSGSGKPTYLKYNSTRKINTLIINAVESEPFATSDYIVALNYTKEIIKTVNWIMKSLSIKECFIAIKAHNHLLKEKLFTIADKYKKIKIIEVPNLYPMGWEKTLVRYIKHVDYEISPIEKGIIINNVSTIYAIHNALKYRKPLTERYVTFTGDGIKTPCNVKVKIGTKASEVLEHISDIEENSIYISNGVMMGEEKKLKDTYITPKTNCILIKKKDNVEEGECIKCGKCVDHCPAKIAPSLILKYKNNKKILKRLNVDKCIECGICSFVCPAKINITEKIKELKGKSL